MGPLFHSLDTEEIRSQTNTTDEENYQFSNNNDANNYVIGTSSVRNSQI